MAANYWSSTQKQNWLFEQYEIIDLREDIYRQHGKIIDQYPLPDRRHIFIFIKDRIMQLGKRLSFRQQCIATALVYLHRYFLFNAIQNVNLYLLIATSFYLASKTEESPHHIRLVVSEARQLWPEYIPSDPARLGEMEFCLISEMHSQLIVWHPYRSLTALKEHQKLGLTNEELSLAWSIINDTFMTDLPLTCPPFLIAITAMFLAVMFVPGKSSLDFKSPAQDFQAILENNRFNSLGGRPGISNSIASALDGSNAAAYQQNSFVKPQQPQQQMSIKARTLVAASNSEKIQNIIRFLVESDIDVAKMIDTTQEIISLYEIWEQYNEKSVKDVITRCIRGQHLET